MQRRPLVILLALVAGCHEPPPAPPASLPPTRAEPAANVRGAPLPGHPGLLVELRGPAAIRYASTAIGLNSSEVTLVVRNAADAPRPVGPARVRFSVRRDGVAFGCEVHDESNEREPHALAPGEAFAFSRAMHCWTPIPGRYEVASSIALGPGEAYAPAGTFAMDVEEDVASGPRACPARPGLYIAMSGDRRSAPIPMPFGAREDGYHAVIVVANGSAARVAGGSVKVAFVVRKKGSDLACGGETIARSLPETFAPGEVRVLRVPVTCIRELQGEYVVTGQLAFEEPAGSEPIEIGRMGVRVTSDPLLLWPTMP